MKKFLIKESELESLVKEAIESYASDETPKYNQDIIDLLTARYDEIKTSVNKLLHSDMDHRLLVGELDKIYNEEIHELWKSISDEDIFKHDPTIKVENMPPNVIDEIVDLERALVDYIEMLEQQINLDEEVQSSLNTLLDVIS